MATKQILYLAYFPLLGKRTRDANFFDTAQALEDRRAVVKESMHGDQNGGQDAHQFILYYCYYCYYIVLIQLTLYFILIMLKM